MNAFDLITAMELSGAAYRNIQPGMPRGSLTLISDKKTDVQCFVRRVGSCMYITFRGSNSRRDWGTNLAFGKKVVPYDNTDSKIRVHHGFLEAYKSPAVRDCLHAMIDDTVLAIKISGHSQGAALAVLCGVDLEYNFPDKDYEVVLFGCPRVGNHAFVKSYNKRVLKTVRVQNGNDIVTKVPFAWMGFRHVGMPIDIGKLRLPGLFSLSTHYPQAYYKELIERFW